MNDLPEMLNSCLFPGGFLFYSNVQKGSSCKKSKENYTWGKLLLDGYKIKSRVEQKEKFYAFLETIPMGEKTPTK